MKNNQSDQVHRDKPGEKTNQKSAETGHTKEVDSKGQSVKRGEEVTEDQDNEQSTENEKREIEVKTMKQSAKKGGL